MLASPVRRNGFTLVEVLVALIVSSLILAIVLSGATEARRRSRIADDKRAAVLLAGSLIALRSAKDISPETENGQAGRLHWTVTEQVLVADPRGIFGLVVIRAQILDEDGKNLFQAGSRRIKVIQPT